MTVAFQLETLDEQIAAVARGPSAAELADYEQQMQRKFGGAENQPKADREMSPDELVALEDKRRAYCAQLDRRDEKRRRRMARLDERARQRIRKKLGTLGALQFPTQAQADAAREAIQKQIAQQKGNFDVSPWEKYKVAPPLDIFSDMAAPPFEEADFPALISEYARLWAGAGGFDFSGTATALVAGGAAMLSDSNRILLSRSSSWFESARLWAVLVGGPGTGKTPMIRAACRPIYDLHRQVTGAWNASSGQPRPALYTSDSTIEKLSEILRDNPRGLLVINEEFDSWIGSHDAYRQGLGSKDRGEWLRLYDGGPHQVDRIQRGSVFVENFGVSLLSATTPASLNKHAKNLPVDGLLQRFAVVLVQPRPEPDGSISTSAVNSAEQALEARLHELYGLQAPATIRLSDEAGALFDDECRRLRQVVTALESSGEGVAAHVSKHAAQLGRVALIYHAVEHGQRMTTLAVSAATMGRALRFIRRLFVHVFALHQRLGSGGSSGVWSVARALGRSILASQLESINATSAQRECKLFGQSKDWERAQAIELLVSCGWLLPVDPLKRYGEYGATWAVNPLALSRFSQIGEEHQRRRAAVRERLLLGREQ